MNSLIKTGAFALMSVAVMAAGQLSIAQEKKMPGAASTTKEVVWPAEQIQFKDVIAGVKKAILWEEPITGRYAALTKFAAGTKNALHTHSSDIKMVVISGTFVYGSDGKENKLGPGSYLLIPAGKEHTSGSDSDCLFFEESPGRFTMNMVKEKPAAK